MKVQREAQSRGWQNMDPEPRVRGGGSGQRPKKKSDPHHFDFDGTLDGSDNDNEEPEDLTRPILPSIPASQSDATLKGDLEEAISAESQREPISLVLINAVNQR